MEMQIGNMYDCCVHYCFKFISTNQVKDSNSNLPFVLPLHFILCGKTFREGCLYFTLFASVLFLGKGH